MKEDEFSYEVGRLIWKKRIQRKMSRETLAKIVGVHRNSIWRWEEGDCPIPLWYFLQMCYALSMPHTMMLPATSVRNTAILCQVERENLPTRKQVQAERDPRMSGAAWRQETGTHGNSTHTLNRKQRG